MSPILIGIITIVAFAALTWGLVELGFYSYNKQTWTNVLTTIVFGVVLVVAGYTTHPVVGLLVVGVAASLIMYRVKHPRN